MVAQDVRNTLTPSVFSSNSDINSSLVLPPELDSNEAAGASGQSFKQPNGPIAGPSNHGGMGY